MYATHTTCACCLTHVRATNTQFPNRCRARTAIDALRSPWIRVDLPNVQSNILIVEFLSNHPAERRTPNDLVARLAQVLPDELSAGVCDVADGRRGIVVRMSSRDWKFARLVVYHQITDEAVDLLIKKLVYCVREWDAAGQPQ